MSTGQIIPKPSEIVSAYRNLLRTSYRAVRYASPARKVLRERMRRAFRESSASDFDAKRIANTTRFLENAGRDTGLEHKVLKNLVSVWSGEPFAWKHRQKFKSKRKQSIFEREDGEVRAYDAFYDCIRGLNQSMGLCIR
jgi:hypothetical protein